MNDMYVLKQIGPIEIAKKLSDVYGWSINRGTLRNKIKEFDLPQQNKKRVVSKLDRATETALNFYRPISENFTTPEFTRLCGGNYGTFRNMRKRGVFE